MASLIAADLGWSAEEEARQVERYRASVAEERAAAGTPAVDRAGRLRVSEGWVPGVRLPRTMTP